MDPFGFEDYKDALRSVLRDEGAKRGLQGAMAAAAGCKSSYLSQVLSGPVHLTPDHGMGVCEFLGFGELETDYFLTLLQEARAATQRLRRKLAAQRVGLRKRRDDLAARFVGARPPDATAEAITRYYSHWHWAALHVMLSIQELTTPQALAPRLGLSVRKTQAMLESLMNMGLATFEGGRWRSLANNLHLPKDSVMANVSHVNWRLRSVQKIQEGEAAQNLFYTGVHSLSRQDVERVKSLLREALERARGLIGPSPEEEAICILCDCFVI